MSSVLGLSAFFHDSSACLVQDGELIAFAEEERFNRAKRTGVYPKHSVEYCLRQGGLRLEDVDAVAYYIRPWDYFWFNLGVAARNFPRSLALLRRGAAYVPPYQRMMSMWGLRNIVRSEHRAPGASFRLVYVPHHLSHAASAFFVSPFEEAAIITIDAAGDGPSTVVLRGRGNRIENFGEPGEFSRYPHSLAGFYSGFTEFLGFRVGTDEYKVMGLAAYGKATFYDQIRETIVWKGNHLQLDLRYFNFHTHGVNAFAGPRMRKVFGPPRQKDDEITPRHQDLAASLQMVLEDILLEAAHRAHQMTGSQNLCLAGGVALNCLMTRRLIKEGPFERVFVQPIANDAGGSLGSAYYLTHQLDGIPRKYQMDHLYLGPDFSSEEYRAALEGGGISYEQMENSAAFAADQLAEGKILGWFQGRMEGGPRALGNRSMLADPRRAEMKDIVNERIKRREYFRPFAPAVLAERAHEYFDTDTCTPYMIVVSDVREEKKAVIPAVTHADGTARVQTVSREENPKFHELITAFAERTGVPVLLNTSFNENEPIVCTPQDAVNCFLKSGLDVLVMGNYVAVQDVN